MIVISCHTVCTTQRDALQSMASQCLVFFFLNKSVCPTQGDTLSSIASQCLILKIHKVETSTCPLPL